MCNSGWDGFKAVVVNGIANFNSLHRKYLTSVTSSELTTPRTIPQITRQPCYIVNVCEDFNTILTQSLNYKVPHPPVNNLLD